ASTASEYLVAIPTRAVSHIQNSAPGPPRKTAVATPAMLPVPTVADSAVIRAWNGGMSPSSSSPRDRPLHISRKPAPSFMIGISFRPILRNRPTPSITTSMGGPQTSPLILLTKFEMASMETPGFCHGFIMFFGLVQAYLIEFSRLFFHVNRFYRRGFLFAGELPMFRVTGIAFRPVESDTEGSS